MNHLNEASSRALDMRPRDETFPGPNSHFFLGEAWTMDPIMKETNRFDHIIETDDSRSACSPDPPQLRRVLGFVRWGTASDIPKSRSFRDVLKAIWSVGGIKPIRIQGRPMSQGDAGGGIPLEILADEKAMGANLRREIGRQQIVELAGVLGGHIPRINKRFNFNVIKCHLINQVAGRLIGAFHSEKRVDLLDEILSHSIAVSDGVVRGR